MVFSAQMLVRII